MSEWQQHMGVRAGKTPSEKQLHGDVISQVLRNGVTVTATCLRTLRTAPYMLDPCPGQDGMGLDMGPSCAMLCLGRERQQSSPGYPFLSLCRRNVPQCHQHHVGKAGTAVNLSL